MHPITLHQVTPQAGLRGGYVTVSCTGLDAQALETCSIVFGASPTRPVLVTPTLLLGVVPERAGPDGARKAGRRAIDLAPVRN